jgi:hypothetical protein
MAQGIPLDGEASRKAVIEGRWVAVLQSSSEGALSLTPIFRCGACELCCIACMWLI